VLTLDREVNAIDQALLERAISLSLSLMERAGCGILSVSSEKAPSFVFVSVENFPAHLLLIIGLGAGGLFWHFFLYIERSEVSLLERNGRAGSKAWRGVFLHTDTWRVVCNLFWRFFFALGLTVDAIFDLDILGASQLLLYKVI